MSLLGRVVERLDAAGIRCALIGADALALRGASRATLDRDLLTTDVRALDEAVWAPLRSAPIELDLRIGDPDDPLAGVVRFAATDERPVDLVVGRFGWQQRIVEEAEPLDVDGARVGVPSAADLVLLKLYAGGPQDAWDVEQLLLGGGRAAVVAEVERRVAELPPDARSLWREILAG